MTTLYERFRASYGRDGPDSSIIRSARGEARDKLEDELIANLDYYEAYALAMLKSVKAVPKLKQHLPISSGSTKVAIARALWDIELASSPGFTEDPFESMPRSQTPATPTALALSGGWILA